MSRDSKSEHRSGRSAVFDVTSNVDVETDNHRQQRRRRHQQQQSPKRQHHFVENVCQQRLCLIQIFVSSRILIC